MRIYTRTGDNGTTSLFSGGNVSKTDARVEAYGTVDELNSLFGWVRVALQEAIEVSAADKFTTNRNGKRTVVANLPTSDKIDSPLVNVVGLIRLDTMLGDLQHELFELGADLATDYVSNGDLKRTIKRTSETETKQLENWIDELELPLEPLRAFILPGGSELSARLHIARTVARRAERLAVAAQIVCPMNPEVVKYLNRLNDLLFVMARFANFSLGKEDVKWKR
ncbi:MAG: cob(I)yrinic acid a,c-diamide adenosyltransferase [bacterium]|nr:cob(I)yrinic acid a,c-diamide adenosyltransferase [bacterium]